MKRYVKSATGADSFTINEVKEARELAKVKYTETKDSKFRSIEDQLETVIDWYEDEGVVPANELSALCLRFVQFSNTGEDPAYHFTERPEEDMYMPYGQCH